jgi:hypothetical protein
MTKDEFAKRTFAYDSSFLFAAMRGINTHKEARTPVTESCSHHFCLGSLGVMATYRQWTPNKQALVNAAAASGDVDIVESLCELTAGPYRGAALRLAAANGHVEIVKYLVRGKPKLKSTNAVIAAAAENGHFAVVEFLHTKHTERCDGEAVRRARANGHIAIVERLLKHDECKQGDERLRAGGFWGLFEGNSQPSHPGRRQSAGRLSAVSTDRGALYPNEQARIRRQIRAQEPAFRAEEKEKVRAEEARIRAEEQTRIRAQLATIRAEEEVKIRSQAEARIRREEEEKFRAEVQARKRAEEEARIRVEEEARVRAEVRAEEEELIRVRIRAEEELRLREHVRSSIQAQVEAQLRASARAEIRSTAAPAPAPPAQVCSICLGAMTNPRTTRCGHTFCTACLQSWQQRSRSCPMCRQIT